jgi:hypothetical protein
MEAWFMVVEIFLYLFMLGIMLLSIFSCET